MSDLGSPPPKRLPSARMMEAAEDRPQARPGQPQVSVRQPFRAGCTSPPGYHRARRPFRGRIYQKASCRIWTRPESSLQTLRAIAGRGQSGVTVNNFAEWLSTTSPSMFIQIREGWMIPVIQSMHITGIGIAVGSALMMTLRLLGWVGTDQTLLEPRGASGPWLTGRAVPVAGKRSSADHRRTGARAHHVFFWLKMSCVAAMVAIFAAFQASVRKQGQQWEQTVSKRPAIRLAAILTFVLWGCIIILGRPDRLRSHLGTSLAGDQGREVNMDFSAFLKSLEDSGLAVSVRSSLYYFHSWSRFTSWRWGWYSAPSWSSTCARWEMASTNRSFTASVRGTSQDHLGRVAVASPDRLVDVCYQCPASTPTTLRFRVKRCCCWHSRV